MEFTTSVQTFTFIFFAGFLTSLTPCIFPMIPITLSVLGAQSLTPDKRPSKLRGFLIALCYVHGISTTYALLGIFAAKTGTLFGSYLANPVVVAFISIIFVLMGLSMFGLFEIQIPSKVQKILSKKHLKKNYINAYSAGLIAGIVASPCVGPVLISLLAYVAKSQNTVMGFLFLFTYAMGLGLIFILLGTFSSLTKILPKSGPWMNFVKFLFGSTLFYMSAYYLKPILPEPWLSFYASTLCLIIFISYFFLLKTKDDYFYGFRKKILPLILLISIGFFIKGTYSNTIADFPQKSSQWISYSEDAISEAKGNKIVLIDFWAEWCEACHTLEKQTFSDPQVKAILDDFLLVKVDATKDQEPVSSILSKYDVTGLPFVMFIEKNGTIRTDLTLTGYEPPSAFLKRLQQLKK